jgi:hypothetical protein
MKQFALALLAVWVFLNCTIPAQAKNPPLTYAHFEPVCYPEARGTLASVEDTADLVCVDSSGLAGIIEYRSAIEDMAADYQLALDLLAEIEARAEAMIAGCNGFNCIDSNGVVAVVPVNTETPIAHLPGFEIFNVWIQTYGIANIARDDRDAIAESNLPLLIDSILHGDFTMTRRE